MGTRPSLRCFSIEAVAVWRALDKISRPKQDGGRTYKGVNFFSYDDRALLLALMRGEHVITGFRQLDVQRQLPRLSSSQVSRHLKCLRVHGLIKRIAHRYKYYVTALGRRAIITGLKLSELFVLPQLASNTPCPLRAHWDTTGCSTVSRCA